MERRIMLEISNNKRKFLESIGIDINNLPPEFDRHSDKMKSVLSQDEMDFFEIFERDFKYKKRFCLKDLIGTEHPNYENKSWLEAFLISKRGDRAVEEYFRNPEYYSRDLKQFDQSSTKQETPLELYEAEGKFFIGGGNNRLSLIMMKYLAEMSRAKTNDERAEIDEKYTFVADVCSIPKDKDIMYMINMLKANFKNRQISIYIERIAKDESSCEYTIKYNDKVIVIKSKEELEQVLKNSYNLDKIQSKDELRESLFIIMDNRSQYVLNENKDKLRILDGMFPNLHQFRENFRKLKEYGMEDKLYNGIDLENINYSELYNKLINLVEKEEKARLEEQQKLEQEKQLQDSISNEQEADSSEKFQINEYGEIIRPLQENTVQDQMQQHVQNQEEHNNSRERISFSLNQHIARIIQKSDLLMKFSFLRNFTNKQLNVLPYPTMETKLDRSKEEFESWISNNGKYKGIDSLNVKHNLDSKKDKKLSKNEEQDKIIINDDERY